MTNAELLGQHMLDAANDLGPETPYGQWEGYWDWWEPGQLLLCASGSRRSAWTPLSSL